MLLWVSFADPHKPQGNTFVGVVALPLDTDHNSPLEAVHDALARAKAMVPNWHDCIQSEAAPIVEEDLPEEFRNRLLTKEEIMGNDLGISYKTSVRKSR